MAEKILIVCVGNICRSPLGEALWNHRASALGINSTARSAGLSARFGDPMHPTSLRLLQESGISPAREHMARPLREVMLKQAELVLVMEQWQREALEKSAPFSRGRIFTLGHWQKVEIPDPMGKPDEAFQLAFELIDQGVTEWLRRAYP